MVGLDHGHADVVFASSRVLSLVVSLDHTTGHQAIQDRHGVLEELAVPLGKIGVVDLEVGLVEVRGAIRLLGADCNSRNQEKET